MHKQKQVSSKGHSCKDERAVSVLNANAPLKGFEKTVSSFITQFIKIGESGIENFRYISA